MITVFKITENEIGVADHSYTISVYSEGISRIPKEKLFKQILKKLLHHLENSYEDKINLELNAPTEFTAHLHRNGGTLKITQVSESNIRKPYSKDI